MEEGQAFGTELPGRWQINQLSLYLKLSLVVCVLSELTEVKMTSTNTVF